jgi:hypothetical protein
VADTDARLWHPWLRINRVLRVMLQTRWSAEAWSQVKSEFKKALKGGVNTGVVSGDGAQPSADDQR